MDTTLAGIPSTRPVAVPAPGAPAAPRDAERREALRQRVSEWVGQSFFGQLMKQMRESPFKTDLTSGGRGGEVFASLLDQTLAPRLSRGAGAGLVDAIVRRLEGRRGFASSLDAASRRTHADAIDQRA